MQNGTPGADVALVVVGSPLSDESALTDDLWTYQDSAHRWFALDAADDHVNAPTLRQALDGPPTCDPEAHDGVARGVFDTRLTRPKTQERPSTREGL